MNTEPANELPLTHIEIIDAQHKKINEHFQKLLELKNSNVDFEVVSMLLDELAEYMNAHFETEENYMRKAGVSEIEKHIQQHEIFKTKFQEFRKTNEVKSLFLNNLNYELSVNFLRTGIFIHTHKFDLLYIKSVQQYLETTSTL